MAAPKREMFEKRLITGLTRAEDGQFLDGIEDVSKYVTGDDEVQVIHRSYLGVKPDVLINNTTYPIPEQALTDEDIPIVLDKYVTKVTPITDDDMYASTYDKIDATNVRHVEAITESKYDKAIHSLAPAGDTTDTPVLLTTGADDGTGRLKLTLKDLIAFRRKLVKKLKFKKGLRLVLCQDHLNDIFEWDEKFERQWADREEGLVTKKYGFEVYDYGQNPTYNVTTKVKNSFGAVPGANDMEASVVFYAPRGVKATGKTKAYFSPSALSPTTQKNTMNYRHYFICMPQESKLIGAIVSGKAA